MSGYLRRSSEQADTSADVEAGELRLALAREADGADVCKGSSAHTLRRRYRDHDRDSDLFRDAKCVLRWKDGVSFGRRS